MSKFYPDPKNEDFEEFDSEPEILTEYYEDHYDQPQTGFKHFYETSTYFCTLSSNYGKLGRESGLDCLRIWELEVFFKLCQDKKDLCIGTSTSLKIGLIYLLLCGPQ
jgi:hypothetical protein